MKSKRSKHGGKKKEREYYSNCLFRIVENRHEARTTNITDICLFSGGSYEVDLKEGILL